MYSVKFYTSDGTLQNVIAWGTGVQTGFNRISKGAWELQNDCDKEKANAKSWHVLPFDKLGA